MTRRLVLALFVILVISTLALTVDSDTLKRVISIGSTPYPVQIGTIADGARVEWGEIREAGSNCDATSCLFTWENPPQSGYWLYRVSAHTKDFSALNAHAGAWICRESMQPKEPSAISAN